MTRSQTLLAFLTAWASIINCRAKKIDSDIKDPKTALFQFFEIRPLGDSCRQFNCVKAVRRMLFPSREPTILGEFYLDSNGRVHIIAKQAKFEVLDAINMLQKGGEIEINARKFINAQELQIKTIRVEAPEIGKKLVSITNELSNQQPQKTSVNCLDGISGFIEYYETGKTQAPAFDFSCHPGKLANAFKRIEDLYALFEAETKKQ